MLRTLKEILGYQLMAKDGQMGKVDNFVFSDEDWTIRYLTVDTGPWIFGRRVLISTDVLKQPVWASRTFPVDLTRKQVQDSPDADLAKPVSRQFEEKLQQYYQWPAYWTMSTAVPGRPLFVPPQLYMGQMNVTDEGEEESHLRSARALFGYLVKGIDGEVGSVANFIFDDEEWQIRYLVLDTKNLTDSNKQVLVALEWVKDINVAREEFTIDLKQDAIKFSPDFDPNQPVNRQYEEVLYDYHGKPKYWQVVEK